jgi:hypothetical protein
MSEGTEDVGRDDVSSGMNGKLGWGLVVGPAGVYNKRSDIPVGE